jgi:hypothetical protein
LNPARQYLVAKWRRAEAEASAWYWDRFGRDPAAAPGAFASRLHDLKMTDAERHARLLEAIAALDLACTHAEPKEIAAAGKTVVGEWKATTAFMRSSRMPEAAQ